MSFQCVIVTPEQQLLDETVSQAIVPAEDGLIGILTGRAPCWPRSAWGRCGSTPPTGSAAST